MNQFIIILLGLMNKVNYAQLMQMKKEQIQREQS